MKFKHHQPDTKTRPTYTPTQEQKHIDINKQIDEFFDKGGEIKVCNPGETTEHFKDRHMSDVIKEKMKNV